MAYDATLSYYGMYQIRPDLFDNLVLPDGVTSDERNTILQNFMVEGMELEALYPNPDTAKLIFGVWSRKCLPVWDKLWATTQLTYDPLANRDYKSKDVTVETRDLAGSETGKNNASDSRNHSEKTTSDVDTTEALTEDGNTQFGGSDTVTRERGAFNAPGVGMTPYEKDTTAFGQTNTQHRTADTTGTSDSTTNVIGDESSSSESSHNINTTDTGTVITEYTTEGKGNIGVTTSQDLLQQERQVALFNFMDIVVQDMITRFCILVY